MIIKISDLRPAHLERLEKFFNSGNWIHYPRNQFFHHHSEEEIRQFECPFAKILKKTVDKKRKPEDADRFTVTLAVCTHLYDEGGNHIKVPAQYLLALMQALDLFSPDFERINMELL